MDSSFYFEKLYPLQDQVLARVTPLDTQLYLTGGTAASRGYLSHRFSDDLDLFANDAADFELWADRLIDALAKGELGQLSIGLRDRRFVRLFLEKDVTLKIELVNDVPSHIGSVRSHPQLGRLDSPENILANKVSALVDREEPKDLADIWGFCCRLGMSIEDALEGAGSKAAGIFPVDVARLLCTATHEDWKLIRWIEAPPPEQFLDELKTVGERLLLLS